VASARGWRRACSHRVHHRQRDQDSPARSDTHDTPVGICGQAPSDHPEFAEFLVECAIDSISVNPDSVIDVRRRVAAAEERLRMHEPHREAQAVG
jgi:phosphoenolpyruvate-protein kinase (PTS system EI component)